MTNGTEQQQPSIPTLQIIAGALIAGVVLFAAVAGIVGVNNGDGEPTLAYAAAGFAILIVPVRFVVPPAIVKSQRASLTNEDSAAERNGYLGLYQTKTIIEYALQEGACFLCLVAFIVTGQWMLYAIVAAFLVSMALSFPTQDRFDNWYRRQREAAELERPRT